MLALETSRTVAGVPDQIVGDALHIQAIKQSGLRQIRVFKIESESWMPSLPWDYS